MPAISAPEPSPRSANSRTWSIYPRSLRRGSPGRLEPIGRLLEVILPLVGEELRPVVADRRGVLVLAALELGSPEDDRPGERPRLLDDGVRLESVGPELVQELHGREHGGEGHDDPRVRRGLH